MKDKNVLRKEPDRLLIEVIGRYDWLFEKLVDYGEKYHGVSHFIIVSSDSLKQKYQALLKQNDSIVTTVAELELKLERLRLEENYDITSVATHYEKKYGYRYLRDVMQQDRGVWASKVPFAAPTWSKIPDKDDAAVYDKINRGFIVLEDIFEDFKPKMILVRPGWIISNVAISIAEKNDLPCSMPRPARHGSFVTWTLGPYSHSAQLQQRFLELNNSEDKFPLIENVQAPEGSRQVFANFQNAYKPKVLLRRFLVETYNYAHIFVKAASKGRFKDRPKFLVFLKRFLLEIETIRYLRKRWLDEVSVIKGKKLLFLLPKEPEYTVQSLSRDFCNIHAMLAHLATSLPVNTTLLIKEHSRVGYRKMDFYKELDRYHNVRFVNPFMPSDHFLPVCDAAATVAGTIAIECCALGKKCLTFSNKMEYRFLPNVTHVHNLYNLPDIVDDVLTEPSVLERDNYKKAASKYYAILEETSFNAAGTKVFEGTNSVSDTALERAWELLCINYKFQLNKWDKKFERSAKI